MLLTSQKLALSLLTSYFSKTGSWISTTFCADLQRAFSSVCPWRAVPFSSNLGPSQQTIAMTSPVLKEFHGLHRTCRNSQYPRSVVTRLEVPDDQVSWSTSWPDYNPIEYNDPKLKNAVWADPDLIDASFKPEWNNFDGKIDRRSHMPEGYKIIHKRPLNPMGRTGISGRGTLGKWGPNHAADPIVTRWKRPCVDSEEHPESGLPILQFVAIQRNDTKQWAVPGGMVDPGEKVSVTLKREFGEEAFASLDMNDSEKLEMEKSIAKLFQAGVEIYKGYVDDPRNTDNAWMETVAVNFHDEAWETVGRITLKAGDDAIGVQWMDLSKEIQLYASHKQFLEAVVKLRGAHW